MLSRAIKKASLSIYVCFILFCGTSHAASYMIGDIYFDAPMKNNTDLQMGIRNIDFNGSLPDGVLDSCSHNDDPAKVSCAAILTCNKRSNYSTTSTADLFIGMKYRMTGADLKSMLRSSIGRTMYYMGCFRYVGQYTGYELVTTPVLQIGQVPAVGGTIYYYMDQGHFMRSILPTPNPKTVCKTTVSPEKIDFGTFFVKQAEGLSRFANLNISCTDGNSYAKFEVVGYPADGLLIRPDGSLKAAIEVNEIPASIVSSVYVESGATKVVPIKATLHSGPNLKGGAFSTNFVVKVTYE